MAQLWTTGPVDLWTGVAGSQLAPSPVFIGHGDAAPRAEEIEHFLPVMCDLGGGQEQFDAMWLRSHLIVDVDLIRVNMAPLLKMRARPNSFTGTPGITAPGDVGSLMLTEALAYPLWIRWPYSNQAYYAGLPNGIHAFAAYLIGPDVHTMGTVPYKMRCTFYCMSVYQPGPQVFYCYDSNMNGLGAIN